MPWEALYFALQVSLQYLLIFLNVQIEAGSQSEKSNKKGIAGGSSKKASLCGLEWIEKEKADHC